MAVAALAACACAAVPSFAQNEQSDVHVVPREQKKDAKPDPTVMPPAVAAEAKAAGVSVDPSLKTHTKPIRKDVDLVLVPVTVTDPMNRLVTGLEKENFSPDRQRPTAGNPALFQRGCADIAGRDL